MMHDRREPGRRRLSAILAFGCVTIVLSAAPAKQAAHTGGPVPSLQGPARPADLIGRAVQSAFERSGVAAASVALVGPGGLLYTRTIGTRAGGDTSPADERTVFRAASLGKSVFAYLVFTLVRDGRLDLDRPLHEYLPKPLAEYPEYADLDGDIRYRAITARIALSHRTGFPNWRWQTKDRKLRFLFTPGEQFLYSGEGYRYLQFVVEHIAGTDLETLARDRVFRPLGMARSSYAWQEEYGTNCAIDRGPIERMLGPDILKRPNCAGSLLTTAADYGRFLAAMLGSAALPARLRDEMLGPETAVAGEHLFGPPVPAAPARGAEPDRFWCLGWGGFRSAAGVVRFHVGYDSPEFENYAVLYLDQGLGLVVLTAGGLGPAASVPSFVEAVIGPTDTPFAWAGYE